MNIGPQPRVETWPGEPVAPDAAPPSGPLLMDAVLAPNRSLSNPAFIALMGALAGVSFIAGIAFVSMGAWPVVGFFGLDVLLVWGAFRLSYRSGRLRETVRVWPGAAEVVRVLPSGHAQCWRPQPVLSRVEIDRPMTQRGQIRLVSSGRVLVLGAFLSPDERGAFGARLQSAFAEARRAQGPPA